MKSILRNVLAVQLVQELAQFSVFQVSVNSPT